MPVPRAFDGYVELLARVSSTGLIHLERNRYSVPTEHAHSAVSLRIYGRVCAFARQWKQSQGEASTKAAFIPLKFKPGEAFQFDWSTEYTFIGGLRRRVELAHTKLCASRAFWLVAYPGQGHEMLFDAHARAFEAFGGHALQAGC